MDWEYINDYEEFREKVKRFQQVFIEEGREEGIELGIEQGKNSEKVATALKGIAAGFSNDIIRTMTGLSDDQINELRQ